ncbi:MAG: hypothetical protein KF816_08430 [Melioribacteraceae bacterium]|nr:hypothetical protein [Melioribacteraceae bacterium]
MKRRINKKNLSAFMRFYGKAIKDDERFHYTPHFFYGILCLRHKRP